MNEKLNILIVDHALSLDEFVEHLEKIKNKVGGKVEIGQIFKISKQWFFSNRKRRLLKRKKI